MGRVSGGTWLRRSATYFNYRSATKGRYCTRFIRDLGTSRLHRDGSRTRGYNFPSTGSHCLHLVVIGSRSNVLCYISASPQWATFHQLNIRLAGNYCGVSIGKEILLVKSGAKRRQSLPVEGIEFRIFSVRMLLQRRTFVARPLVTFYTVALLSHNRPLVTEFIKMRSLAFATVSLVLTALSCPVTSSAPSLGDLAIQKVLADASPIFGYYNKDTSPTAEWMSKYPDSTLIVHMNIPGAHDPQTWNYSLATQEALNHVTDLDDNPPLPPQVYRCQEKSFIDMLNAGIRVFDIRYAYDVTNSTLVFWHSQALLSETATVDDVLFGFYQWLDDHKTEALFLSFQYEGSTTLHGTDDAGVQISLFNTLTSPAAKKYFLKTKGEFGTLGEARGKITLLQRFDFDLLPASYTAALPGCHFSPSQWTDNDPNITLVYNPATNATAYIEDYYSINLGLGTSAAENIAAKYDAVTAHLNMAATQHPNSLFWSFASSENDVNVPIDTPEIMAVGNGTDLTPLGGVNQQLVPFFQGMKGKRLGIVMFDYFDVPSNLIDTFLAVSRS